ncbi:hypothetical protein HSX37_01295|uniref:Type 4 fimbrial biogenesis protein PilX N-terminal domain-containing protein n=1 Tax=Dendrosporobacter quercicolus TaxID=146817 RepID=A0A1G9LEP3_9FIRM|nr:hypothetical protein [Dendrosporobacter quercicolus]NSL46689.1 hypothetical protein [Dendrosporobacter quercicolus DSM 1736]SDL60411.1 hypothetical protein SAMN04488502_101326 [Dendrosporobacter quercicolus]
MTTGSRRAQSGSAALLTLIVLALLGVIGIACFRLSLAEYDIAASHQNGIAAQYLAEAGVQHAIARLRTDPLFLAATGTAKVTPANTFKSGRSTSTAGDYQVAVTGTANHRTIIAVGRVATAKRQLVVTVAVVAPANGGSRTEIVVNTWKNHN